MPVWKTILVVIALIFAAVSIFLWIFNNIRAKKLRANGGLIDNQKSVKIPFKIEKFIDIFGGINNIIETSVLSNRIKIKVVSIKKVDFFDLKKIKNQGILEQSDSVTIVLGEYAQFLSEQINKMIKK